MVKRKSTLNPLHIQAEVYISITMVHPLLNVSSLIKAELNYSLIRFHQPEDIHEEQETNEEILKEHILNLAHVKEVKIGELCLEVHSTFFIYFRNLWLFGHVFWINRHNLLLWNSIFILT